MDRFLSYLTHVIMMLWASEDPETLAVLPALLLIQALFNILAGMARVRLDLVSVKVPT